VPEGTAKPYSTSSGDYYVKSGGDKRKSSPQELLRMFQTSKQITLDESPTTASITPGNEAETIDLAKFYAFYDKNKGKPFSQEGISIIQGFENMGLADDGHLTLAGLMLFGVNPQRFKPTFLIRAFSFYGNENSESRFRDKNDCIGSLEEQYRSAMAFLKNNLSHIQTAGSFNQPGTLEISEQALEEAVVNALIHRDYSQNAVIRLFIFDDRVEIISPGCLPNHLTIANIINGKAVVRNPTIVSFATKILPYSGIGSGITRILKYHPDTIMEDDKEADQFIIKLMRPIR
jgi:predicted HTH transcriptional regulator